MYAWFVCVCLTWSVACGFVVPTHCSHKSFSQLKLNAVKSKFQFDNEQDFYFTLNVTREAEPKDIRRNYLQLAKQWHPDVFVDDIKFEPESLSVNELQAYLNSERVITKTFVDKKELVDKAWECYKRTKNVNPELTKKRVEITNRFALLNEAYNTLYDEDTRRSYNLSGDWGIPGLSGTRKSKGGMGDREEAERVRERGIASQRTELQEKVFRRYMKEKAEEEAKEAVFVKERDGRKALAFEESRKERERLGIPEPLTPEEQRIVNQEKIKAMWGNMFNNVFGGDKS